jgi:hypothetical protein
MRIALASLLCLCTFAQPRWWMDEPIRLVQTNLRETDTGLDPARLIRQVEEFPANALLFGMGGIVAHYPTKIAFHYPSAHLPVGRDTFGEVLRLAHARGIRVIGRFDLSKTQKAVWDAHPEWFFRRTNGEPVVYNGLYSTCINGRYYRDHALKILAEALERYEVDGLFFNMFGNPAADYSGVPTGPCACAECRRRFRERYGRELAPGDPTYGEFMQTSRLEVARAIGELIRAKRPKAAFLTYVQDVVDGIMSESNTAVDRRLPMWPYSASDNVNRARNSQPDKMAFNLAIGFVDIPYRFVTVPPAEIRLRLYQNMAHGAGPAFVALGTLDQEDRNGILAAKRVFEWHKRHAEFYVGQRNAARVLLLGGRQESYRGFFRILSEKHIPFAVSDNHTRLAEFDLVIAPDRLPGEVDEYLRQGGRLLAAGTALPGIDVGKLARRWTATRSAYFRVRDRAMFPSLADTNLIFVDGEFLEFEPHAKPLLTFIPPSMYGPPEKVHVDWRDTDKPGVIVKHHGKGRIAYVPWDVGALYYRLSSPGHAGLVADLVDHLLGARQLTTNAHPLVEITVMRQPARGRTLVHFVNVSGHSSTGYFDPLPMREIEVRIRGEFREARSAELGRALTVAAEGDYRRFVLPSLADYDVVALR